MGPTLVLLLNLTEIIELYRELYYSDYIYMTEMTHKFITRQLFIPMGLAYWELWRCHQLQVRRRLVPRPSYV